MIEGKLNILIGGAAGAGIEKSGQTLTRTFVRSGYFVFANTEHMSQIRGGNNFLRIRVDDKFRQCHVESIDIMIALDRRTIEEHLGEMVDGGVVIFDESSVKIDGLEKKRVTFASLPLKKTAEEKLGNPIMENVISLGIVMGLIGMDIKILKGVLNKTFAHKGAEVVKLNEQAADLGVEMAGKWAEAFPVKLTPREGEEARMFLMGNDAGCMGAVRAGLKFVGEYPMTPSSSYLHLLAKWTQKYGIVVKQTEDEIAAVNSVIGAGVAGARAMTATSGGGFSLMTEGIGLAGMNEVPIVVVNVMRPGPATGLPTRTGQGDLRQIIHAGQDDPVKIVLLPGDVYECFGMIFAAFNLAEKYQLPVIVSYDKYLGEGHYTVPPFNTSDMKIDRGKLLSQAELDKTKDYKRYLRTEDGVSPRAIPGMKGGTHRATSDEHTEYGEICEEAENRRLMMEKRMKKLETALTDLPEPELIGEEDAEITFVTWNSSKGACLEAVEILSTQKIPANVLQIKTAYPFHKKKVKELLEKCKRPILVEQNYTGQMGGLIAENTGIILKEKILRYDGRPLTAQNVVDGLGL